MINKNEIIVFTVSFLVGGFFLLSAPESGFSGTSGCCINLDAPNECPATCFPVQNSALCSRCGAGASFEPLSCEAIDACRELPPQITTLSQWGKIITIAVIGLFAVIGLLILRRGNVVRYIN